MVSAERSVVSHGQSVLQRLFLSHFLKFRARHQSEGSTSVRLDHRPVEVQHEQRSQRSYRHHAPFLPTTEDEFWSTDDEPLKWSNRPLICAGFLGQNIRFRGCRTRKWPMIHPRSYPHTLVGSGFPAANVHLKRRPFLAMSPVSLMQQTAFAPAMHPPAFSNLATPSAALRRPHLCLATKNPHLERAPALRSGGKGLAGTRMAVVATSGEKVRPVRG